MSDGPRALAAKESRERLANESKVREAQYAQLSVLSEERRDQSASSQQELAAERRRAAELEQQLAAKEERLGAVLGLAQQQLQSRSRARSRSRASGWARRASSERPSMS